MTPAVDARPLRRRTFALLAASLSIAGAAALLHARTPSPHRPPSSSCGGSDQVIGGMHVAVRAESCKVLRGSTLTHVEVELTASSGVRTAREPIAMGLVIDRSGSMLNRPLRDAKDAALRAVDALAPGDAFSIVTYSTEVETIVPIGLATDQRKAEARAAIERIRADGNTNLSAGLETGAASLQSFDGNLDRVILISDGRPNEGISGRDKLSALAARLAGKGISISTIGVGLEFDERVMTQIAVAGRGNYYFVESSSDLPRIFEQELGSLGETVAVDARLAVTPGQGVEILEAYGYDVARDGTVVSVPIADLRAGETRKVVLEVRVDGRVPGAMELVSTRLSWRQVGEHQARVADGAVRVDVSDDATAVARSRDLDAVRGVQEAQLARAIDQASDAYEQGDAAKAQTILETQAAAGAAAARDVGDGELEQRIEAARHQAAGELAVPAKGDGGRRATKNTRNLSYDLAR
jgi:Ca-activated chloride channel family protein